MTKQLEYELADGTRVPLFEAEYDTAFKIFKSDRRKAKVGDPKACIEALGICRKPNVLEAHIGSGKDAYVVYSKTPGRSFKHAVHHTMPAQSGRVRDQFEVKGSPKTQTLFLKAPSSGRTLAHRKTLDKKRRAEVKAGAPVKKRGKPNKTRIHRLGVAHRPRAKIKAGVVTLFSEPAEQAT
jgi:hypothetical protein